MRTQAREFVALSETDSPETDVRARYKQEHRVETKFQRVGTCESCHRFGFGMNRSFKIGKSENSLPFRNAFGAGPAEVSGSRLGRVAHESGSLPLQAGASVSPLLPAAFVAVLIVTGPVASHPFVQRLLRPRAGRGAGCGSGQGGHRLPRLAGAALALDPGQSESAARLVTRRPCGAERAVFREVQQQEESEDAEFRPLRSQAAACSSASLWTVQVLRRRAALPRSPQRSLK